MMEFANLTGLVSERVAPSGNGCQAWNLIFRSFRKKTRPLWRIPWWPRELWRVLRAR